jgi:hypothetical protein
MKKPATDQGQEELALMSVASHQLFGTRSTLYVKDVKRAWSISEDQVVRLIVSGDLGAINISAKPLAKKGSAEMTPEERKAIPRNHWRIPVSAYDDFIAKRNNLTNPV